MAALVMLLAAGAVGYGELGLETSPAPDKIAMPFAAAQPIVAAMQSQLPAGLAGKSESEIAAAWAAWTAARDGDIRARLYRGDEDSVVHLWLYGTSFTTRARATAALLTRLDPRGNIELVQGRLDDLVAGLRAPGDNDRLVMARRVLERAGIDVMAPTGQLDAARHLETLRKRLMTELARLQRDTATAELSGDPSAAFDAYLTYYRSRGLSSDTSLLATYSVERALETIARSHAIGAGSVRRVAIIGPGLDFVDKADGHDFYPQQTLQPFALVDSLIRFGLASRDGIDVTAFDISPRVTEHLVKARERVRRGQPYLIHLPLDPDDSTYAWDPGVEAYWQRFGQSIGTEVAPRPVPPELERTRVRAVRVRPELVTSVRVADLNVILERATRGTDGPFDLVLATNVLVYYEPFEQALALANVAAMLRPNGLFLANTLKSPLPVPTLSAPMSVDVLFDRSGGGDTLFWFRRLPLSSRELRPAVAHAW